MRTTRRRAAVAAIGATALLFAATACTSESTGSTESAPDAVIDDTTAPTDARTTQVPAPDVTASPATDAAGGVETIPTEPVAVPEALRFTAPLVGGGTFDGAAAAGKPTVFWFWAPT